MLYIAIPPEWESIPGKHTDNTKDHLINQKKQRIELQDIVKDCLRTKGRYDLSITINDQSIQGCEITIYYRRPPDTEQEFLMYQPEHNGKFPATKVEIVKGRDHQIKFVPTTATTSALFFVNHLGLSETRRKELRDRAEEIRYNRRHLGDSPNAT